jgi:hypothetical protein
MPKRESLNHNQNPMAGRAKCSAVYFMKKLLTSLCIGIALIITPIAFDGCASFNPPTLTQASTDQIILRAEQAAESADLTFNTFVHLERDNEALLKETGPAIHTWADTVRAHGQEWVRTLRSATRVFKANRTAENQATLNTALATLIDLTSKTNAYLAQARKVSQP